MGSSSPAEELVRREVPDWDDDVLAAARFKAFSGQRSDWEPKYVFWRDLILKVARGLGVCTIPSSQVKNIWFSRRGLSPLCLNHVLLEMYKSGDILLKEDLVDPTSGRFYQVIKRVGLLLGFPKVSPPTEDFGGQLIFKTLLEEKSVDILKKLSGSYWNENCIITMKKFRSICKSNDEALAVMSYLAQGGKATYLCIRKGDYVEGLKISLVSTPVSSISSLDYNLLQLIWTTEMLQQQLAVFDQRWMTSRKSAIASLNSGNKQAARRHVRQMKLFSESRSKCSSLLDRVEEVIGVIADAESTKKVSEAIQIGTQAIKENKISIEEVHHHLQEFEEAVASQKKVQGALESMPFQHVGIEDEELEEEFSKLELEVGSGDVGKQTAKPAATVESKETELQEPADILSESLTKLRLEAA